MNRWRSSSSKRDPAGLLCGFQRGEHPGDILDIPGMDVDRDRGGCDPGTVDGGLEVLADDHRHAGTDDRHALW